MKWMSLTAMVVVIILFILYQMPRIMDRTNRDKWAFIVLTAIGFLLGVLLIYNPDMPGPTKLVDMLLKPFAHFPG